MFNHPDGNREPASPVIRITYEFPVFFFTCGGEKKSLDELVQDAEEILAKGGGDIVRVEFPVQDDRFRRTAE